MQTTAVPRPVPGHRNSPDALVDAYQEHARRLQARARRIVVDPHLAEEVVQEAFIRAWRAWDSFDEELGSLPGWLLTITANTAIDMARARGRRPPVVASDEGSRDVAVPPRDLDRVGERDQLRGALAQVSPQHREAVVELVLRDRPHAEVARELGVKPGTLRTRLHYALRELRRVLAAEECLAC